MIRSSSTTRNAWLPCLLSFAAALNATCPSQAAPNRNEIENILLYQRACGGWPKNYDRDASLSATAKRTIASQRETQDATIDNGATHVEIRLLAAAYQDTGDKRLRRAALAGIDYLLRAQYANGGWPQRFPLQRGYSQHITFNDNAMIGTLTLLRRIARNDQSYDFVDKQRRESCVDAVQRGIECILACQIQVAGQRTVWCAQHDATTLKPAQARSYELPSFSGNESVGVVRFLMDEPPRADIVASIQGALEWFERAKITGRKVVRRRDPKTKQWDRYVVDDATASPLWARFYDLKTNQPFFCSRDGIPQPALKDISHERRNGYSWLGTYAQSLLTKDAPRWQERITTSP